MFNFKEEYNRNNFVSFLSKDFLPEDFNSKEENLGLDFCSKYATSAVRLGKCTSLDLEVFEITHNSTHDARVGISSDAFQLLLRKSYCNRALVAFISEGSKNYRFSLLQIEAEQKEQSSRITRNYSNPRRYSYFLGEDAHTKTPEQFLREKGRIKPKDGDYFKDLLDRFSVEVLAKEFYKELFEWYKWTLSDNDGFAVTFPNDTSTEDDDRNIDEHIIRLITRLMFVWFIKQKKLVPENIFKTNELKQLLTEFDPTSKRSGNYYNAILQNLFFATLNKPINERKFATDASYQGKDEHYGIKTLFRNDHKDSWFKKPDNEVISIFKQVPFLNGGLFECLDKESNGKIFYYDGFSRLAGRQKRAFLPNCLFFDDKRGLIPLLEKYNFTIEENTPSEIEVALDPELLGKVFENLLGAYNPETKEVAARNESGSFYTPREIVNYMVDESLIAYLKNACPDIEEQIIRKLFTLEKLPVELLHSPEKCKKLITAIKAAKILDPACGSGAFPMGMLNKMVEVLRKLEFETNSNAYELKLHLIENCIYGVDIQTIAVQITKLRFFISLVCEQTPTKDANNNYGVKSLPNLEAKFVSANTLLSLNPQSKEKLDLEDEVLIEMKNQLWDIRCHKNFSADTWQKKMSLRKEDKELCKRIEDYLFNNATKSDVEKIARYQTELANLQHELSLCVEEWVDDTEAPKVQLSFFEEAQPAQPSIFRKDKNKARRDEIEETIKRLKKDIEAENKKATLTGLEAEIHKMIIWDLYDQNSSSPFFDAEWMFGLPNGFDIVIGNPPYISIQRMKNEEKVKMKEANYKSFENTGDIYALFYERGNQLLKPKGVLTYITSRQWIQASYGKSLRNYFATETNPLQLIDFGQNRIFEGATVFVNILMFQNAKFNNKLEACLIPTDFSVSTGNLEQYFYFNKQTISKLNDSNFSVSNSNTLNEKIEQIGTALKQWKNVDFNAGIKTAFNDAFHIQLHDKKSLIDLDPKNIEIIKPMLRGKDIKRYGYEFNDWFLINTHNGVREKGILPINVKKDYPTIYQHFLKWPELKERQDQGDHWTNLRNCAFLLEFEKPKIVWIEISDRANYAYDDKGMYLTNSAYFLTCKNDNVSLKYLLAVLNSKVADFYFSQKTARIAGGRMRYTKQYVEQIPIPEISLDRQKPFISLVDKILFLKDASKQDSSLNKIIYFFEHVVDLAVYELYFKEDVHKAGFEVLKYVEDSVSVSLNIEAIRYLYLKWNDVNHPLRNAVSTLKNYEPFLTIENQLNRKSE